eukprot:gene8492-396_t
MQVKRMVDEAAEIIQGKLMGSLACLVEIKSTAQEQPLSCPFVRSALLRFPTLTVAFGNLGAAAGSSNTETQHVWMTPCLSCCSCIVDSTDRRNGIAGFTRLLRDKGRAVNCLKKSRRNSLISLAQRAEPPPSLLLQIYPQASTTVLKSFMACLASLGQGLATASGDLRNRTPFP